MSESYAHEGGIDPDGWAPSTGGTIDEALSAEIADHLAAAAGDLVKHGAAEDQAFQMAVARFGDVERIKRQCWWIQKGDEVMLRTLGIAILGLLTMSVVAVAVGAWQLGRNLASRTEELSEQLASLTATQQAMLAQQQPPAVTGRCFLGDPSKPARNVEVQVFRFSEEPHWPAGMMGSASGPPGVVIRRLRTDSEGRFDSGILQAGEYCLLAPILAPDGSADEGELPFARLQSQPLNLTAGVGASKIDLDLAATSQLQIMTTGIPKTILLGTEHVPVDVMLTFYTEEKQRYFERKPVPPSDEPPQAGWPVPLPRAEWDITGVTVAVKDLPRAYRLPPRAYYGNIELSIHPKLPSSSGLGGFNGLGHVVSTRVKSIPFSVTTSPGAMVTLTVSVTGEPIDQRIEAMTREWEKSNPAKLGTPAGNQLFLNHLFKEIELQVEQSAPDSSAQK